MGHRFLFTMFALASSASAVVFDVGPGKHYPALGDVPWNTLNAGDVVEIYWKSSVYREKFCLNRSGTALAPITVRGIPGSRGELPVIDGANAVTARGQSCWNDDRGVIKIGGGDGVEIPQNIVIEQVEIQGAKGTVPFTAYSGGTANYIENASGIFVERGYNITIRRCNIHDNGNGIFVASGASYQARDILIERNYIHDNGYVNGDQQHNTYTSAINIIYQFNRMTLPAGRSGNNLKDRSANAIYRYNWIESGNRQLDLVEAGAPISQAAGYQDTYVYGNVLIDYSGYDNGQLINFGGDGADKSIWRQGTIHIYNNTVVSYRFDDAQLVRIGHPNGRADIRNNIVDAPVGPLFIISDAGTAELRNNWLKTGWKPKGLSTWTSVVNDLGGNITSTNPGFVNEVNTSAADYHLLSSSPCLNKSTVLNPVLGSSLGVAREYVANAFSKGRLKDGFPDLGAYEYAPANPAPRINTLISKPL